MPLPPHIQDPLVAELDHFFGEVGCDLACIVDDARGCYILLHSTFKPETERDLQVLLLPSILITRAMASNIGAWPHFSDEIIRQEGPGQLYIAHIYQNWLFCVFWQKKIMPIAMMKDHTVKGAKRLRETLERIKLAKGS